MFGVQVVRSYSQLWTTMLLWKGRRYVTWPVLGPHPYLRNGWS